MPSTPTPRLRVMQQARGKNINAWGDPNLNNALQRLEEGQAKVLTLAITGNVTLSVENYLEDQARSFVLVLVGTPAAAFKVTIPSVEKPYLVDNRTGQVASIGAASGAVAAVRAGIQSMVFCDASDTYVVDLTLDRIRAAAAPLNLNGQRLTNLAPATSDTDATTRKQVTDLTAASVTLASQWATKLNGTVDGSEYSAKEYAVGATTPLGSAKAWATATAPVAGGQKGALGYANDAASSASSAGTSAGTASTAAQAATDKLADFNNRYVVGGGFPVTGNFAGRLAWNSSASQLGVYDAGAGAYQVLALPVQATEAAPGIIEIASASEAITATDNIRAMTPLRVIEVIGTLAGEWVEEKFTQSGVFNKEIDDIGYLVSVKSGGASGGVISPSVSGTVFAFGGRGGDCAEEFILASDVPQSLLVTVGAGGAPASSVTGQTSAAPGNPGGDSSFGSLLTARGAKANTTANTASEGDSHSLVGGSPGSGPRTSGSSLKGGGAGAGLQGGNTAGSLTMGIAGESMLSGNGGATNGAAGSAPSGGGAAGWGRTGTVSSGPGARGEVRVLRFKRRKMA